MLTASWPSLKTVTHSKIGIWLSAIVHKKVAYFTNKLKIYVNCYRYLACRSQRTMLSRRSNSTRQFHHRSAELGSELWQQNTAYVSLKSSRWMWSRSSILVQSAYSAVPGQTPTSQSSARISWKCPGEDVPWSRRKRHPSSLRAENECLGNKTGTILKRRVKEIKLRKKIKRKLRTGPSWRRTQIGDKIRRDWRQKW